MGEPRPRGSEARESRASRPPSPFARSRAGSRPVARASLSMSSRPAGPVGPAPRPALFLKIEQSLEHFQAKWEPVHRRKCDTGGDRNQGRPAMRGPACVRDFRPLFQGFSILSAIMNVREKTTPAESLALAKFGIGQPVRRTEDPVLVQG